MPRPRARPRRCRPVLLTGRGRVIRVCTLSQPQRQPVSKPTDMRIRPLEPPCRLRRSQVQGPPRWRYHVNARRPRYELGDILDTRTMSCSMTAQIELGAYPANQRYHVCVTAQVRTGNAPPPLPSGHGHSATAHRQPRAQPQDQLPVTATRLRIAADHVLQIRDARQPPRRHGCPHSVH